MAAFASIISFLLASLSNSSDRASAAFCCVVFSTSNAALSDASLSAALWVVKSSVSFVIISASAALLSSSVLVLSKSITSIAFLASSISFLLASLSPSLARLSALFFCVVFSAANASLLDSIISSTAVLAVVFAELTAAISSFTCVSVTLLFSASDLAFDMALPKASFCTL